MCKRGDIILVNHYVDNGKELSHHSFVVLEDKGGVVHGFDFDFVAVVMSSFHDEEHKKQKLSYPGNFPVGPDDESIDQENPNKLEGYIKSEQFYFFDKNKIEFSVIGALNPETMDLLIRFIEELSKHNVKIKVIIDNLL